MSASGVRVSYQPGVGGWPSRLSHILGVIRIFDAYLSNGSLSQIECHVRFAITQHS